MMTRQQCLKIYGSDYLIQKQIEAGHLFRVDKGIFSEKEHVPGVAVVMCRYNKAIITMRSAFYMHGLTDVIPDKYDLATTRNAAKISDERVNQYFVQDYFFQEGVDSIEYKGYQLPVYSKERMLIELIRYKSKLPFDYYKEIISSYRRKMPELNIQTVQDIALIAPKSNMILDILQMEVF